MLHFFFFFLMIRRPPRSTLSSSSAASDVYKRQVSTQSTGNDCRWHMAASIHESLSSLAGTDPSKNEFLQLLEEHKAHYSGMSDKFSTRFATLQRDVHLAEESVKRCKEEGAAIEERVGKLKPGPADQ
eukprot:TRINITY_DN6636_c0_g1_i2.p1 TRINITY_DN6636_c0_g1~~TRINITY_DN6636_c0_g1_i2.p1  ORF type:complete len:128 (+),score=54.50 TRINITY_DN6636_c0_g1_i2:106-489(+)